MTDDVPDAIKRARFHRIEALQKQIQWEDNQQFVGETVEVLVENMHKGRWRGRNPQNKLVFFDDPSDLVGQVVEVVITHAGPYSMSGKPVNSAETTQSNQTHIPLAMI
jgi:tRNA-2-methylthio-N6-dimethylallyladenosine synthase